MKVQELNLYTTSTYNRSLNQQNNKPVSNPITKNEIGSFPSYYCPNINFGTRFGDIDFGFDFYNCANNIINHHLDKMELTKDLNEAEQKDFRKNLFSGDKPNLLQFFNDKKPSVLLSSDFPYFKNNDKYDFVRRTLTSTIKDNKTTQFHNTFIINKELAKETIKENQEFYYNKFLPYTQSNHEYEIRFFYVIALNYFINDTYLSHILNLIKSQTYVGYYDRMAVAWFLSIAFISYPSQIRDFLKNTSLDTKVYQKTISKINDSYQIKQETKQELKSYLAS